MPQLRHLKLGALILAFLLPGAAAQAQAQVVVPAALADMEGNSNNAFPFNCTAFGLSSMRYQQVYLGSEIGTGEISELRFRLDGFCGTAFGPEVIPNITVQLSSTMTAHPFGPSGGLSSIFAENIGPDATTVFAGDLALFSRGRPAVPMPFEITIPVRPGFFFDSSTGANLLLDVSVPSCALTTCLDAQFQEGDSVARAMSSDSTSPTATIVQDTLGLVTQIIFMIFEDGFESGDTSAWSFTEP
jgi:hypothetical protein